MFRLIRGSGPMSAEERAALAFIERRLPGPDDKPYLHPEPKPPTEDERATIKALVDYYLGCQKRRVAGLYALFPESPHLLRAISHLDEGRLLSSTDEEFFEQNIRNDLTTLKRIRGRKLDYTAWRNKRVEEQRVHTPALQRLLFDRRAAALELDRRHLRYCSRCEQVAIPTEANGNYGGDVTCPFCHDRADMTLVDAQRQGLVRLDDGFWEECHRPVPAWATSHVGLTVLGPQPWNRTGRKASEDRDLHEDLYR